MFNWTRQWGGYRGCVGKVVAMDGVNVVKPLGHSDLREKLGVDNGCGTRI